MWSTGASAVTFGYTFAQPRATYSTHPMPVPGGYAFAHSDNSRAAVLSRSASSLCPPSGKTFPSLYGVPRRGTSVSFPYKTGGLDVCIISRSTQFVNRLIPLFSRMYFLHDNFAYAAPVRQQFVQRLPCGQRKQKTKPGASADAPDFVFFHKVVRPALSLLSGWKCRTVQSRQRTGWQWSQHPHWHCRSAGCPS